MTFWQLLKLRFCKILSSTRAEYRTDKTDDNEYAKFNLAYYLFLAQKNNDKISEILGDLENNGKEEDLKYEVKYLHGLHLLKSDPNSEEGKNLIKEAAENKCVKAQIYFIEHKLEENKEKISAFIGSDFAHLTNTTDKNTIDKEYV